MDDDVTAGPVASTSSAHLPLSPAHSDHVTDHVTTSPGPAPSDASSLQIDDEIIRSVHNFNYFSKRKRK